MNTQITSIQPPGIETEFTAVGVGLTRTECVLVTQSGALIDSRALCNTTTLGEP